MPEEKSSSALLVLGAQIVGSYLRQHKVAPGDLPDLIGRVHGALSALGQPEAPIGTRKPAVPVGQSVRRDHVVCLECGFRGQAIRRHLNVRHGLTPAEYRARWRLGADHPIIAPAYAERRSAMAKKIGLGRRKAQALAPEPTPQPPRGPKRRGRPRAPARDQASSAGAQ